MRGQIIERGKNAWQIRIPLGRDSKGKRKYHNKTIHGTKKDAQKYQTAKQRELDLGMFLEPTSMLLNEYLDKWLAESVKPRLREPTYDNYVFNLRKYVRDEIGVMKLSEIKPYHVQKIYNIMTEKGLSPRTVRYTHTTLKSAFTQAMKWQMLSVNPCNVVDLPRQQKTEMKVFTPEEARLFLEVAKDDKQGIIFAFALASGMRPEEYLALKWTDIDFQKRTAKVQRTLIWRKGGGWYYAEPKTPQSRRTIPLPETLVRDLQKHKVEQSKMILKLGEIYERNNLVFATDYGKPIYLANLRQRNFASILKKANLKGFRIYDLRHTMATLLLLEGVHPKIVSERLGHASIVLTLDTYSHVLPTMQLEASNRLEKLMFGT